MAVLSSSMNGSLLTQLFSGYLPIVIGMVLCLGAQYSMTSTFNRYAKVLSRCGLTGAQVAQKILEHNGITDVSIQHVQGNLTDHYDPRSKVVRLSDMTFGSHSIAAIGVAAHECGHVCQHHYGYSPLKIRTALVPAARFGSGAGVYMILIGLFLGTAARYASVASLLITVGIWAFAAAVLFQFVTLPVEFDASRRALVMLEDYGILSEEEVSGSRKVLRAAAMTYVASAASSFLQLVRLLLITRSSRR